jgi:hypothetical protein
MTVKRLINGVKKMKPSDTVMLYHGDSFCKLATAISAPRNRLRINDLPNVTFTYNGFCNAKPLYKLRPYDRSVWEKAVNQQYIKDRLTRLILERDRINNEICQLTKELGK